MYRVLVRRRAAKDPASLLKDFARLIARHIDDLTQDPRPAGAKKLKGDGGYSLRVGIYRVLYDIDDAGQSVYVYRIRHRREAYR